MSDEADEVQRTLLALVPTRCVICDAECNDINHDAQPIKQGRCCPDCNIMVVVPFKLNMLTSGVLTDIDKMEMKDD